ncbi:MAG: hypothetical protein K0R09_138 [Clostridiales bacterium]|jgi:hypothetical protein|nr:hypothetical protein [Clostridiales bacterium]
MGIMSLSEIMDRAVDFLRKYIKGIVLYSLCYGLIYAAGVFFLIFGGGIFIALSVAILPNVVIPIIFFTIIVIIIGVMALASKIGVIKIASQAFSHENIGFGEALGASFKNLHKVIGIFLIELLLLIPVLLVFGLIFYFIYNLLDTSIMFNGSSGAGEIVLIIIAILTGLAFLLVILMYSTMFSFTLQAAVIERMKVFSAIKRGFSLIRRNFWRIFGTTLLIGLTIYAIQSSLSSFLTGILSLLFLLLKLLNLPLDYLTFLNLTISLTSWPLEILSWLIITPIGTIMTTLLYYNQRFKKEGYDMVIRLKDIQKNDERKQSSELV